MPDANDIARQCGADALRAAVDDAVGRGQNSTLPPPRMLDTVTAAELAHQELSPAPFVVPGYIAEGVTFLAGPPKTGKSFMALGLSISVASGGIAFGSIRVEQRDVLYLALEDNHRRLQRRIAQMMPFSEPPNRLHLATECPQLGSGGLEAIENWCDSVERPGLIVLDVFEKLRPERRRYEGVYEADYRAVAPLKKLADQRRLAVLPIHHTSKREKSEDPFDAVSGSTGLTAAADTIFVLSRTSQGITLYGRGRDIEEIEVAMSFDRITGLWTVRGQANEVYRSDERSAVERVLRSANKPMSPQEIAAAAGMKDGNVRRLVLKMVVSGEIEKVGRGQYTAPGNNGNAVTTQTRHY